MCLSPDSGGAGAGISLTVVGREPCHTASQAGRLPTDCSWCWAALSDTTTTEPECQTPDTVD